MGIEQQINNEVARFSKIWENSKQVNPKGFNIILSLFLATVDEKISTAVELKIMEKYK